MGIISRVTSVHSQSTENSHRADKNLWAITVYPNSYMNFDGAYMDIRAPSNTKDNFVWPLYITVHTLKVIWVN